MISLHLHVKDALALLTWKLAQLLLDSLDCLMHGPQFLLYSLRIPLTVVVEIVPIVLERVLNIDQQF